MKASNLLGWFIILLILSLFALLVLAMNDAAQPPIKAVKKPKIDSAANPHPECNACRIAHQYSLNINLKHYGVKESIE